MNFNDLLLALNIIFCTVYGAVVMFILLNIPIKIKNILFMSLVTFISLSLFFIIYNVRGLSFLGIMYAFSVHLPFILVFMFWFKQSNSLVFVVFFLTYFSLIPRSFFGQIMIILSNIGGLDLSIETASRLGELFTAPLVFWPFYKFIIPKIREILIQPKKERIFLLNILGGGYLFNQTILLRLKNSGTIKEVAASGLVVFFMYTFIVSLSLYLRKMKENRNITSQMAAYSMQTEGLTIISETMSQYIQDTARIRHDHRYFLSLLNMYLNQGNIETAKNLISENLLILDSSPIRTTGNDVVDGIIQLFSIRGKKRGVTIKISGNRILDLPISKDDLCILLSNSLDNAIEATANASKSNHVIKLSVSIDKITSIASLIISNPCETIVKFKKNGLPITEKGEGHGFGTCSIEHIIEKNKGAYSFKFEEGFFVFSAVFFPKCNN